MTRPVGLLGEQVNTKRVRCQISAGTLAQSAANPLLGVKFT
jgi:hypothetical protein